MWGYYATLSFPASDLFGQFPIFKVVTCAGELNARGFRQVYLPLPLSFLRGIYSLGGSYAIRRSKTGRALALPPIFDRSQGMGDPGKFPDYIYY
jgi:hypothetical protein